MEILIEKDVPIPPLQAFRKSKYPFAEMQVGDSFVFTKTGSSWAGIYTAMKGAQDQYGIKLTSRQIGDHQRRIWRTA